MSHLVIDHALINSTRIAHGTHGAGIPVVLLHGTPSSSYIWRNVLPSLVNAGYKVHAFDLLGFGLSERPWDPEIDTSVTGQVPILDGLLDLWGLEDMHLIGHDIGGAVAKRFALQSPQRVRSLTVIDPVSFDSWPSKRTQEQMQAGLERLIKAPDADHRAHFRDWLLSAVQNKRRMADSSMDIYLDFITGPIGQSSLFQHQVRHYKPHHTNDIAPRYSDLGALPVQLIWGAEDTWQVIDWAHKLHSAIPGSELHILEDCGHFAMEDQPERISDLLVDFLNRAG
ncbi:alpha/beta fold hydrolase [Ruegeria meonggei]|uniref:2-hydroxy-6-oxononadienedioate/2-hydroxy-6-oxononatrienedioate hydrolase n=1 Tax=Ruegeria meonggei TaxID=1446476 RepID=A0A1X7A3M7_9RHOB|nr:alpha/beta hydrolase [Ruegeria meonggei]SLN69232.1 2-hydroxy-6-oxononadienedioate/2-hydroxy-6-oxononatrienedioate hydrolase [Ruegeria meonggei]